MKYQIIPQDETVLVQLSEEGVNETLNMQEGPDETSLLVQSSRKDVLVCRFPESHERIEDGFEPAICGND